MIRIWCKGGAAFIEHRTAASRHDFPWALARVTRHSSIRLILVEHLLHQTDGCGLDVFPVCARAAALNVTDPVAVHQYLSIALQHCRFCQKETVF